ncbi:hypothetical protein CYMTET_24967 [Cymbomonas tetramitiformis]|uniref:Uncharacterized protein n=1 Tax=Cymbomonas tetramitiformis TaxID=36881 RepID=A0AAE0FV23_9CHLO|nr:hypothetical protein CYMTET_24967 [Cymbomonas tetramitiformis]
MPLPVVSTTTRPSPAASVSSGDVEWTGPPDSHPFMPQPVTRTFADFIGATGFTVEPLDPEPHVRNNMMSAVTQPTDSDRYATSTGEEDIAPSRPQPSPGCGRPIPGFDRSLLTSSMVCALFLICATAAPLTAAGFGDAGCWRGRMPGSTRWWCWFGCHDSRDGICFASGRVFDRQRGPWWTVARCDSAAAIGSTPRAARFLG